MSLGGRGRYSRGTTDEQIIARHMRAVDRQLEYRKSKQIIHNTKQREPMSLENYEPVAVRLDRWLKEIDAKGMTPRVLTEMLSAPGADICVIKAELWVQQHIAAENTDYNTLIATGHAEEVRGQGNVNRTSHVENCETSAIGRALANAGAAGASLEARPSREEMAKVQRMNQTTTVVNNTTVTQAGNPPSEKQLWLLKKLIKEAGKLPPADLAEWDKYRVSKAIEQLKAGEAPEETPLPDEEPF